MIKVLIADDSSYIRVKVRECLEGDPAIEVVGIARDGADALKKTLSLRPDVIIMDVDMPKMSGARAATHIMKKRPTPIIMMIEPGPENNHDNSVVLDGCLVDYIFKDDISKAILIQKVYLANMADSTSKKKGDSPHREAPKAAKGAFSVVGIGISTGGPKALSAFLPKISPDIGASILIAQHMPPSFTHSLAERLNEACDIKVKEAEDGEPLIDGYAYICPGGMHMVVERTGFISLYPKKDFPHHNFIPSADLLVGSISHVYGPKAICMIMTGMGSDGFQGVHRAKENGSYIIAQSQCSSTIFGMPKAIIDSGLQDEILDLKDMGPRINDLCIP